jgi:hypothetical protein
MKTGLSVCCITADPPERVAYTLGLFRHVADEIVIAVDSSVAPASLTAFAGVTNRIYRFDFRPPVDRPRAWLAAQSRSEWILWIDGDEVPSPALVHRLPDLVAARDVLQYWIPRRWLFPDPGHWLEETPWWPDFQIRLVRNDPAITCYGTTHEPIASTLPARLLDTALYHLSPLVFTTAERREKCRRYNTERPGMVSRAGGPFNETLQIPEQYVTLRPVPVPDSDRRWIAESLAAGRSESANGSEEVDAPLVDAAEIDAFSPDRDFDEGAYRAHIGVLERDTRFAPGVTRHLLVRVENHGNATWPWGFHQRPWVRVSYHWRGMDGRVLMEGKRTCLPTTLRPGESALVSVEVAPPGEPGRYALDLDLVHEMVRWFDCSTRLEVAVADRQERVQDPSADRSSL